MTLKFRCSLCGHPQGVEADKAGTSIFCLHCSAETSVPAISDVELGAWTDQAGDSFAAESWPLSPPSVVISAPSPAVSSPPPAALPAAPLASDVLASATPGAAAPSPASSHRRARWLAALLLLLLIAAPVGYMTTVNWQPEYEPNKELLMLLTDTQVFEDKLFAMGMPIELDARWLAMPMDEPDALPGETFVFPPLVLAKGGGGGGGRVGSGGSGGRGSGGGSVVRPPEVVPDPPMPVPMLVGDEERTRLSDKELFLEAMKAGDDFMKTGNFEQAIVWYKIAGEINTTPELLDALNRAEQGRLDEITRRAERKRAAEEQKKYALFERLLIKGNGDLVMKSYDSARKVFEEAGKLFPGDRRVQELLSKANYLKAQQLQENALTDDERKLALERKATRDYKLSRVEIEAGLSALQREDYRAALMHFTAAREFQPGSSEAYDHWLRAKRLLAERTYENERRELEELKIRQAQQKADADKLKLIAYDRHYAEGMQLVKSGKFELAQFAFQQALDARPGDKDAQERRAESETMNKQAQRVREAKAKEEAEQAKREAAEAARQAEQLKRAVAEREAREAAERLQAQYKQSLTQGYLLLAQGKLEEAESAVAQAGKLMPMAGDSTRLLEVIAQARTERQEMAELARKRDLELQQARDEAEKTRLLNEQRLQAEAEQRKQQMRREQANFSVLQDVQVAVKSGQYDTASLQIEALMVANPDNKGARQFKEQIDAGRRQIEEDRALERNRDNAQLAQLAEKRRRTEDAEALAHSAWQMQQDDKRRRDSLAATLDAAHRARSQGNYGQALSLFHEAATLGGDKAKIDEHIVDTKNWQTQTSLMQEIQARQTQLAQASKFAAPDLDAKQAALDAQQRLKKQNLQGKKLFDSGDFDGAYSYFEQSIRMSPGDAEAKAGIQRARDAQAAALERARKEAAEVQPVGVNLEAEKARKRREAYDYAMKMADSAMTRKSFDLALRMYRLALEHLPGDPPATDGLGRATQARAEEERQRGIEAAEAERRAQARTAERETRQRELERVAQEAKDLHALKIKQNAELLDNLVATARACMDLHRWDAAGRALAQAAALAPDDPRVRRMQAALDDMQRPEGARPTSSPILPLNKADEQSIQRAKADVHVEEGRKYLASGQFARALQSAEAALALHPGHPAALQLRESAKTK